MDSKKVALIKAANFADEKLKILKKIPSSGEQFTVKQVILILSQLDHETTKLSALKLFKNKIVDKGNKFKIISHFPFESDQKKANKILKDVFTY